MFLVLVPYPLNFTKVLRLNQQEPLLEETHKVSYINLFYALHFHYDHYISA